MLPRKDRPVRGRAARGDQDPQTGASSALCEALLEEPTAEAALDYLISAAVRQQLQRPTLARLLDVEESRATFRQEMTSPGIFQTLLVKVVERSDMPRQKHSDIAAGDVYAMIRGMVDAAGERGESDVADLKRRVRAAVFGYLSGTAGTD